MAAFQMETEISARIDRFQRKLKAHELDGALLVHKVDLFYLSGTDQDAHLWVPSSGPPVLMVRKSLERARADAHIKTILPLPGFSSLPELILAHTDKDPRRIGLEMDILPAAFYVTYQELFPNAELVDISPLIRGVRMVKSHYELRCIEQAAAMADRMYETVAGFLRDSKTETDLALQLEAFYRGQGHPGFVRTRTFNMECLYGQVMSGKSAAMPSNSPGPTGGTGFGPYCSQGGGLERIRPHEPVFVDYAANVEGYIADQARIFSIGSLPEKFHRVHGVMLEIQQTLAEMGRPGIQAGDLYAIAVDLAAGAGLSKGFMGYPDPVPFVAHGVGLEIDEWPIMGKHNDTLLEPNMVFAVEPKFVFPGEGVVGVENTFVVTPDGMRRLNRFPDAILEC